MRTRPMLYPLALSLLLGPAAFADEGDHLRAKLVGTQETPANVHTSLHPAGEIRGQIRVRGDDDD